MPASLEEHGKGMPAGHIREKCWNLFWW